MRVIQCFQAMIFWVDFLSDEFHTASVSYSIPYLYEHNCLIIASTATSTTSTPTDASSAATNPEDDTTTVVESTEPALGDSSGRRKRQSG